MRSAREHQGAGAIKAATHAPVCERLDAGELAIEHLADGEFREGLVDPRSGRDVRARDASTDAGPPRVTCATARMPAHFGSSTLCRRAACDPVSSTVGLYATLSDRLPGGEAPGAVVAEGLANRGIAARLILGEATVKTHVKRIISKLDLRDRVHAVVIAYETGPVRLGEHAAAARNE